MTGIKANLIEQIAVKGSIIGLLIKSEGTAVITLKNPLDTPFAITNIQAAITFSPSIGDSTPYTVGTIKYDLPSPEAVPAKGSTSTSEWPVAINHDSPKHLLQMLEMLIDPEKYYDVEQNVTITVGDGYKTTMYYYQKKIPFSIQIDGLPPMGITADSLSSMSLMSVLP